MAENTAQAVRAQCMGENGLYQDGPGVEKYSQHCQVWAVLTETAPNESWKELMRRTLEDKELAKCSVAMVFYLFRAVEKAGLYEESRDLWQLWRDMLQKNLTTCEEDGVNTRSDCHAWGSVALYEIPAIILGVRPTKPGFEEFEVRPNPGYLDWAKGTVITPRGFVDVEWKYSGSELELNVKTPDWVRCLSDGKYGFTVEE